MNIILLGIIYLLIGIITLYPINKLTEPLKSGEAVVIILAWPVFVLFILFLAVLIGLAELFSEDE